MLFTNCSAKHFSAAIKGRLSVGGVARGGPAKSQTDMQTISYKMHEHETNSIAKNREEGGGVLPATPYTVVVVVAVVVALSLCRCLSLSDKKRGEEKQPKLLDKLIDTRYGTESAKAPPPLPPY